MHAALRNYPPIVRRAPLRGDGEAATLAFFAAYFSNFIEGTEFDVDSASDIVFRGLIPSDRPEDAHDVLGTWRIVIPTIYRSHSLTALKAITQNGRTEPLIRMLDFAQKWTAAIDWRTVAETRPGLDACNAFLDPSEADEQGKRLRMPNRVGS